ncbi:MAG TPA: C13 family peptidase [Bryobacteraceae bacterium]|nr:C13 family peptidase [Bryobacteraceae bacterium]
MSPIGRPGESAARLRVLLLPAIFFFCSLQVRAATFYLTIAGLGGEPDYDQRFAMWADEIETILKGYGDSKIETLKSPASTRANIRAALEKIARESKPDDALVVMLIGHGSYDGYDYKMNLPGPDLTGTDLAALLDRVPTTRQLVVNMTSASGGAMNALRKENRVVITATKAGTERNATVFARYFVEALRDPAADTDKNDTISALEAFHYAQHKVAEYYETEKRLATEHALLEDTGKNSGVRDPSVENREGLRAAAFPLVHLGAAKSLANNPEKKKLLAKKEQLEQQIDELKYNKSMMAPDQYKKTLTGLLIELAKTQQELDQ